MASPTAPPPASNSSAPAFKSNASGPSSSRAPAEGAPASSEAAAPPRVDVPFKALFTVLAFVGELRALGFLLRLEIPNSELTNARAPALFDRALAAFLTELKATGATCPPLILPPLLGDGSKVELLPLFLAVRARGGFEAVPSWAAVAEAVGLDPFVDAPVKLVYYKYLFPLEQRIGKPLEQHELVEESGNGVRRLGSKKNTFLPPPTKGPSSSGSANMKRKRDAVVDMLNWVRNVANNPNKPGVTRRGNSGRHLSAAVLLRRQMFANKDCRDRPSSSKSGPSNEGAREDEWDDVEPNMHSIDRIRVAPIRPCGQADIPEWIGKPSSSYDDQNALKFLGKPILLPESIEDIDIGSIGKGRPDDCNCQFPGSIACVRFHVAEKRTELKCELGSAFYEMGFDRIGEEVALAWTKDEERKFNIIMQKKLPTSKSNNIWDKLLAAFRSKGREGVMSYYHNVFQVWRRAYQNRLTPKSPDSDEGSIEPGFLYLRQGDGQSSTRSGACFRKPTNSGDA